MKSEERKMKITFNGEEYSSIEDLPQEIQEMIKDSDGNDVPDFIDNAFQKGSVPNFISSPLKRFASSIFRTSEIRNSLNILSEKKKTKIGDDFPEIEEQLTIEDKAPDNPAGSRTGDIMRWLGGIILGILVYLLVSRYL
jgi:hypothetical protein